MLNAHTEITFPPETHFFKRYILPYLMRQRKPEPADLNSDSYLQRLGPEKLGNLEEISYNDLNDFKSAFLDIVLKADGTFLGDKDTEYVRYLPHLKRLFPEAYLIHIVRDPRDVVVSRLKTEWGRKRSLAFHAAEYQYYIKQMVTLGPELFGDRYLELRYESLLDDPERELRKITERLGLEFEKDMLNFQASSSNLVSKEESAWKQNVTKPLLRTNQGKWKASLKDSEAALIEMGIEPIMAQRGYTISKGRPGLVQLAKKSLVMLLFALKTEKERLR